MRTGSGPVRGLALTVNSDMEIISYVVEGALEHKDSIGTGSVIRPRRRAADVGWDGHSPQRIQSFRKKTRVHFPADLATAGAGMACPPSYEP